MKPIRMVWSVGAVMLCAAVAALAADAPAAGKAAPAPVPILRDSPEASGEQALGPAFESQAAGIAFRAPPDCKEIRKPVPDEIVEIHQRGKRDGC